MLSSTKTEDEFFEEHFQQISPVRKHILDDMNDIINDSNMSNSSTQANSIKESIDLQATFVSQKKKLVFSCNIKKKLGCLCQDTDG